MDRDMEKEFKQIERRINRLYDLHEIYLASFEKDAVPDLEKRSQERESEVKALFKDVKRFLATAENKTETHAKSMILALKNRMITLLEQNKTLQTKASVVKGRLEKDMKQVSKGKKAIGSYRSSTAVSNSPKVISITAY